jgi:uncharacterized protein (TIGR03083 family)
MSKEAFRAAATFFSDTVDKITSSQWDEPALGVWNVRDLVGHTNATVASVAEFAPNRADNANVQSAAQHYHISLAAEGIDDSIAEEGKTAGQELGDDVSESIHQTQDTSLAALNAVPDGTVIGYYHGGIKIEHYLEMCVLELTIHTLDIISATGIELDPPPAALSSTLHLLADLAVDSGFGGQLALLATGRGVIPDRFSVLG